MNLDAYSAFWSTRLESCHCMPVGRVSTPLFGIARHPDSAISPQRPAAPRQMSGLRAPTGHLLSGDGPPPDGRPGLLGWPQRSNTPVLPEAVPLEVTSLFSWGEPEWGVPVCVGVG